MDTEVEVTDKSGMIVLSLALNGLYCVLVVFALPMVIWKRIRTGKYRLGWEQKLLGLLPARRAEAQTVVWLHAVSVGEVLQLRQVVDRLRKVTPVLSIVITTTTETGFSVAREKFPDCEAAFFPLDFTWSVRRALNRVRPDLIVMVELELWPNFLLAASSRQIPLALINGRLSARSFAGYCRVRPLVQRLLKCFAVIGVQTEEYRERFLSLGADPARTQLTGSIKFDGVSTHGNSARTRELAEWMALPDRVPVFIAGSTQAPEEAYALQAYSALLTKSPSAQLVIVPRHPERGSEIAALIRKQGFAVRQRSTRNVLVATARSEESPPGVTVNLLDTVGELGACWGLASVAFVGGSFSNRGGQNMLEPAAYGAAVCFGPNTWNFKQIVELLLAHQAAQRVHSADELQAFVDEMVHSPQRAKEMGERSRQLVLSQQGATDRTVELLMELIPLADSPHRRSAA